MSTIDTPAKDMGVKVPWGSAVSSSITNSEGSSPQKHHEESVTISQHLHKGERVETDDGLPSAAVLSEHTLISEVHDQGKESWYKPSPPFLSLHTLAHTYTYPGIQP